MTSFGIWQKVSARLNMSPEIKILPCTASNHPFEEKITLVLVKINMVHQCSDCTAQGVRAGGRPQQAQQQQQPTRGDHERIRLLEEELKAQKENIEHLLKAAKEEVGTNVRRRLAKCLWTDPRKLVDLAMLSPSLTQGEREGREAAERLISEKQQKYVHPCAR